MTTTNMTNDLTSDEYIAAAREQCCDESVIIYEDSVTSHVGGGCWVAAWVWVPNSRLK